jgi:hypothetical protein
MSGLSLWRSIGLLHFNEFQANLTKRYANGLTVFAALQLNAQHDADYFANPYDTAPTWEPSNNSMPYRITGEGLYELPLGKGKAFAKAGIASTLLGGFQLGGSYERQPGPLLQFGNLFYLGTPSSKIKLKHPVYVNNLGNGSTYTGTGFVTNPSCQPNGYNARVFPQRVDGLRQQATDTIQASLQRNFHITEQFNFKARCEAYNLLNRQVLAAPITTPTSSNFGQVVADGG